MHSGSSNKMPKAGQVLLTKKGNNRPIPSKSVQTSLSHYNSNMLQDSNGISTINQLTVNFPKVYVDQRHGYSLLRGEYGDYFADTSQVDKVVKEYVKTGDDALQMPFRYDEATSGLQMNVQGSGLSTRQLPRKLSAAEFFPIKRKENPITSKKPLSVPHFSTTSCKAQGDFIDRKEQKENLSLNEMNLEENTGEGGDAEDSISRVHFQLGSIQADTECGYVTEDTDKYFRGATPENSPRTLYSSTAGSKFEKHWVKHKCGLRPIKVAVDNCDGDDGDKNETMVKQIFVDDSDPNDVQIFRLGTTDSSLVRMKNAKVRQALDGTYVLIKPPQKSVDEFTGEGSYDEEEIQINLPRVKIKKKVKISTKVHKPENGELSDDVKHHDCSPVEVYITEKAKDETGLNEDHATGSTDPDDDNSKDPKDIFSPVKSKVDSNSNATASFSSKGRYPDTKYCVPTPPSSEVADLPFIANINTATYAYSASSSSEVNQTKRLSKSNIFDLYERRKSSQPENKINVKLPQETSHEEESFKVASSSFNESSHGGQDSFLLHEESNETAKLSHSQLRLHQLDLEKRLKPLEGPQFFSKPPPSRPLAICFDCPGTGLTHRIILEKVLDILEHIPHAAVTSLEYIPRHVILGEDWVAARWVIELSTHQCMTVLMGRGMEFPGENAIQLRYYDDVLHLDYKKFIESPRKRQRVKNRKTTKMKAIDPMQFLKEKFKGMDEPLKEG